MRNFIIGLLLGITLTFSSIAFANNPIKLIVNEKEIQCDVPPQLINGRVMVPIRFIAESLGAKIEWDTQRNAVIITSNIEKVPDNLSTKNNCRENEGNNWISWHDLFKQYQLSGIRSPNIVITNSMGMSITITKEQTQQMANGHIIEVLVVDNSGKEIGKVYTKIQSGWTYFYKNDLLNIGFIQ